MQKFPCMLKGLTGKHAGQAELGARADGLQAAAGISCEQSLAPINPQGLGHEGGMRIWAPHAGSVDALTSLF